MQSTVTYSPDDDKLRLYVGRVPRDEYERLRAAGFVSTPKQDCDFVATWTPGREDLASEYLEDGEDIGDEDYTPEDRAADKAERFEGYRDNRRSDAHGFADAYDAGPSAFGHQNRGRAERQAKRHERKRGHALGQWSKAEYWQHRTEAVIRHALHRYSPVVRRGRILRLEAEQRKHEAGRQAYATRYAAWQRIATMDGADELLPLNEVGYADCGKMNAAQRLAYTIAGDGRSWWSVYHPSSEEANEEARRVWKHGFGAYDLLTKTEFIGKAFERLTPRQVAELYLAKNPRPDTPDTYDARWSAHYELRLAYERAMLEAEGGTAAAADIEPGGWIRTNGRARGCLNDAAAGWVQVQKVNKSPATGRVTSVKVWGTTTGWSEQHGERITKPALVTLDVERLPENAYRAPTDEERAEFQREQKAAKAKAKASKPKTPSLVNPTDEDAERLQAIVNAATTDRRGGKLDAYGQPIAEQTPLRMTQSQYSAESKGDYARCETRTIHADGRPGRRSTNLWTSDAQRYDASLPAAVCKVRMRYDRVVILTDKPQKPLPLDWDNLGASEVAAEAAEVGAASDAEQTAEQTTEQPAETVAV
jgi:hypothetical protein